LSLVPFAALPIGERSYLLETGPVIHYLSAERDLVAPLLSGGARQGLLAVGGASFNDRTAFRGTGPTTMTSPATPSASMTRGTSGECGGLQSVKFQPLTGTLQEVRDLSDLWNRYAAADPQADAARVLAGRGATEIAFKREAGQHRVLHLATHGFFLDNACAPAPTGTRGVGGLARATRRPVENPLLLSGLALAGANQRALAGPDEDEGILTAEEVAMLDLHGVEWAVLSACDTGVGEIKAGEGVFGLRRAFQVAGARTVVMSLWSVEDQATRAWMRALYEGRFQRKLSTADAVHQASLAVLRDRRARGRSTHPFFWAAFVAAGDWR
jgi:CHAT domain-containing protein